MSGADEKTGHPLPESKEARHNEIPERMEREKCLGDEGAETVGPSNPAVNPDGEPYLSDDAGAGPATRKDG